MGLSVSSNQLALYLGCLMVAIGAGYSLLK